ncbi:MAG: GNAT family N-acetyltransferase [Allosphingosinicella sp.]|uniref:GNAT family N-acetyltransferase n=1 Tax=Allosphingosinicella sp. TaxID=2823234 RepID=UPI003959B8F5
MTVRFAAPADAAAIAALYAPFVEGSAVSLEDSAPTVTEMAARIAGGGHLYPWLVAEDERGVAGFASASRFRPRQGYRFTVETSVYVAPDRQGAGLGRRLYMVLIDLLTRQGFTQAIAALTAPNDASAALHRAMGFKKCGTYGQVGWKLGQWWDVALWQRALAPQQTPPQEPRPYREVGLDPGSK